MGKRIRNSPPIREIILAYLSEQPNPVEFSEICKHVVERATFTSKTPKASIFSVITRMPEVVRTEPSKYALSVTTKQRIHMTLRDENPLTNDNNRSARSIGIFPIDTVQFEDCVEAMKQIPDNSIDLVIADPPYNASKGNVWKWDNSIELPGFGGAWSKIMANWDSMPLSEYFAFTIAWLTEVRRIVRPTGSIWVHGTFHNNGVINFTMQLLEIEIINELVWYKRNSFPNLSRRRLTASHETLLWAHTGGKKRRYFFDYDAAKMLNLGTDILKTPGKQLRTVWDIPNNKERRELDHGKHPAQKPLRLLKKLLEISTKPGSIVLAPFAGSGSECIAAKELGRHFLGFENDQNYYNLAQRRLQATNPTLSDVRHCNVQPPQPLHRKKLQAKQHAPRAIPVLIKWTGSKRSQAHEIARHIPDHRRYFEPFIGGGSLLYIAESPGSVASDIYEPLIDLWKTFQTNPQSVVNDYADQWDCLQRNLPGYFYEARERFNLNPNPLDLNFLVRTCVNGIIRFNRRGEFNNSFHLSRRGMMPERFAKVVQSWAPVLRDVTFKCQDYEDTLAEAQEGDFVYLDPPYAGNNARYTSDLDLDRFFTQLQILNRRNIKWGLSFDGRRGNTDLSHPVPEDLYQRKLLITNGNSPVGKVLNGPLELVRESLYLNY